MWDRWKEAFVPKPSLIRPVVSIQDPLVTDGRNYIMYRIASLGNKPLTYWLAGWLMRSFIRSLLV